MVHPTGGAFSGVREGEEPLRRRSVEKITVAHAYLQVYYLFAFFVLAKQSGSGLRAEKHLDESQVRTLYSRS